MKKLSRRQFVMSTATVVALSPSIFLTSRSAGAADMPKVDLNDPQAKALSYVHESPSQTTSVRIASFMAVLQMRPGAPARYSPESGRR